MRLKTFALPGLLLAFSLLFSCEKNVFSPDNPPEETERDTIYMTDTLFVEVPAECENLVSITREMPTPLYIGLSHNVVLKAVGVDKNDVSISIAQVSTGNANIPNASNGVVQIVPTNPGEMILEARDTENKLVGSYSFNVKRLPDPFARLGTLEDGHVPNATFKAQGGVIAWQDDLEYDVNCDIVGFEMVYIEPRQDPVPVTNAGASYNSTARNLVQRASPGDIYLFNNVRARCPGDVSSRRVNSMVFFIR